MSPLKAISYQLYLFQLENYDLGRFIRLIRQTGGRPKHPPRKRLIWTAKATTLFISAVVLQLFATILLTTIFQTAWVKITLGLITFSLLSFVHFAFLLLSDLLLWPADFILKQIIISRAKRKIQKFPRLKIIGITGSYGKTTMKEVLATILSQRLKVLKTPENVNTPVGIGRLILQELTAAIEVLVVEMGAYRRGDIQALCELTKPQIAILTGINEAHLERFGSLENTVAAKFEIVENSVADGLVLLNQDDKRVMVNYQKFVSDKKVKFYSSRSGQEREVSLLGDYVKGIISAATMVARELGLTDEEINRGISQIEPIPHRLQLSQNPNGITIIDDSYNANPEGVKEALKVLGKFAGRRKIYVTPGLVEMGERSAVIHRQIGQALALSADLVVLIKNSVTPFLAEGLKAAGYPADRIKWYDDAQTAYAAIPNILKVGDVVLFQNDWPDNYF